MHTRTNALILTPYVLSMLPFTHSCNHITEFCCIVHHCWCPWPLHTPLLPHHSSCSTRETKRENLREPLQCAMMLLCGDHSIHHCNRSAVPVLGLEVVAVILTRPLRLHQVCRTLRKAPVQHTADCDALTARYMAPAAPVGMGKRHLQTGDSWEVEFHFATVKRLGFLVLAYCIFNRQR